MLAWTVGWFTLFREPSSATVLSKDLKPMKGRRVGREATIKTSPGRHPLNSLPFLWGPLSMADFFWLLSSIVSFSQTASRQFHVIGVVSVISQPKYMGSLKSQWSRSRQEEPVVSVSSGCKMEDNGFKQGRNVKGMLAVGKQFTWDLKKTFGFLLRRWDSKPECISRIFYSLSTRCPGLIGFQQTSFPMPRASAHLPSSSQRL